MGDALVNMTVRLPKTLIDEVDQFCVHFNNKHNLELTRADIVRKLLIEALAQAAKNEAKETVAVATSRRDRG